MRDKLYLERYILKMGNILNPNSKSTFEKKLSATCSNTQRYLDILSKATCPEKERDFHTMAVLYNILEAALRGEAVIHTVAERFAEHLTSTKVDVPCSHLLVTKKPFYVEFPKNLKLGYECAMIAYGRGKERSFGKDLLMIALPEMSDFSDISSCRADYYYLPIAENQNLSDALGNLEGILETKIPPITMSAIAFAAKCLLYINSKVPDILNEYVVQPRSKNPHKLGKHWAKFCPFNVKKIGYSYHGRNFHKDSTEVSGHFRWQPCGVKKQDVKLIWIEEHLRQYSTEK